MVPDEVETLILEMAQKSKKGEEEVRGMVQEKINKFSGLLTEQGAVFLVQKELGLREEQTEEVLLRDLQQGMKGIEVKGVIESSYPIKEFEKNSKKGKLKSVVLSDATGEARLTLWNDQVEMYPLARGAEIKASNVIVSIYNDKKQLSLGFNGKIEILKQKEEEFSKVSQLKSGMNSANIVGRILRKFPSKEFEKDGRKGKLCSFQIGDETAVIRATAWNDKAEEMEKHSEGDAVEIRNAYTKEGMFGPELHLGYTAEVKESARSIPSTAEILKGGTKETKIAQTAEGENTIINAEIAGVERGNFLYDVCSKCGKKATRMGDAAICENCGETTARKNAVVSLNLRDETGEIRANFFGKNALAAMKVTQEALEKMLSEKTVDLVAAELNGKLSGEKIRVLGYTRISAFSGNKEFSAKEVIS